MRILSRGSRELSGHLIPRCNRTRRMRASPSLPLPWPPSALKKRSGVTRPRSGFDSVPRRVSHRVHCVCVLRGLRKSSQRYAEHPLEDDSTSRERLDAVYPLWKIQWTLPVFGNEFPGRTRKFSNGRTSKLPRIVINLWSFEVSACRDWLHHVFAYLKLYLRSIAMQ